MRRLTHSLLPQRRFEPITIASTAILVFTVLLLVWMLVTQPDRVTTPRQVDAPCYVGETYVRYEGRGFCVDGS